MQRWKGPFCGSWAPIPISPSPSSATWKSTDPPMLVLACWGKLRWWQRNLQVSLFVEAAFPCVWSNVDVGSKWFTPKIDSWNDTEHNQIYLFLPWHPDCPNRIPVVYKLDTVVLDQHLYLKSSSFEISKSPSLVSRSNSSLKEPNPEDMSVYTLPYSFLVGKSTEYCQVSILKVEFPGVFRWYLPDFFINL